MYYVKQFKLLLFMKYNIRDFNIQNEILMLYSV